jgi:hypothetical protein
MECWVSEAGGGSDYIFFLYTNHIKTDLIPPNPVFHHSIIPILHSIHSTIHDLIQRTRFSTIE